MKIKVLYVISGRSFYSSKPGRKISSIVKCWRRIGYDVKCIFGGDLYLNADSKEHNINENSYGNVDYYNAWYRNYVLLKPFVNTVSEFRDIQHDNKLKRELRFLIEEWKPNLIWERSCRLHISGITQAQEYNIPYVLEWKDHLLDYGLSLLKPYATYVENKKNKLSSNIVIESAVLKRQLAASSLNENKIQIALNAVEKSEFSGKASADAENIKQTLHISSNKIVIGYMGSYAFYHDVERLVLAAKMLEKENLPVKFLLVGVGKHYEECLALAKSLNLESEYFSFHEPVSSSQVPSYLNVFDIAVLPGSTDIICPIKIQEYMAAGLPVVLPDYECNREVISEGIEGRFFKPFSEDSLAEVLRYLIENSSARQKMGVAGAALSGENFSWEATWGKALNTVIGKLL